MSHPIDIHVGRKLKEARTLRRMSQTDVARRLKLSFQQIQKYEIGSNRIAASRLFELSQILDVPVHYFFDGVQEGGGAPAPQDPSLQIVTAVASIQDETIKSRIVTFIEDVSGRTVAKSA